MVDKLSLSPYYISCPKRTPSSLPKTAVARYSAFCYVKLKYDVHKHDARCTYDNQYRIHVLHVII